MFQCAVTIERTIDANSGRFDYTVHSDEFSDSSALLFSVPLFSAVMIVFLTRKKKTGETKNAKTLIPKPSINVRTYVP